MVGGQGYLAHNPTYIGYDAAKCRAYIPLRKALRAASWLGLFNTLARLAFATSSE